LPQDLDSQPFQIDHVIARQHGGTDDLENLALACFSCNKHKGSNIAGIDRRSAKAVPLFHPRHDRWADHFRWRKGHLLGLTAGARATIDVLQINAPLRAYHRQLLISAGLFPPK
jgi:hypothetical protein